MYLLDTSVVLELRRNAPHVAVLNWLESTDDAHLFISAVTVGHIQANIELTREQDPAKATELDAWLTLVSSTFNVLAADASIFRLWAQLMHRRPDTLVDNALIAATAQVHGLALVSRNEAEFAALGAQVFNPFLPWRSGIAPTPQPSAQR